jgi:hypothetical protein
MFVTARDIVNSERGHVRLMTVTVLSMQHRAILAGVSDSGHLHKDYIDMKSD